MKIAGEMESFGQLASSLAHEFKNILMPVVAYPELMLRELPEDSAFYQQIQEIREAGERVFTVVEELCELNHRDEMLANAVRVDQIIKEFLASTNFKTMARQYGLNNVVKNFQAEDALVNGSARSLSLVIGKMLCHSARRVEPGGRIDISTWCDENLQGAEGAYVAVSVKDHGAVMLPEEIAVAFDTHAEGDEVFGLGLPLLHGIVKNMNGHVRMTSCERQGTELTVLLPMCYPDCNASDSDAVLQSDDGAVLVVDEVPE